MLISDAFVGTIVTSTTGECFEVKGDFEVTATVTWSGNLGYVDCNACTTANPCA
jgi:hypothetical protein